MNRLDNSVEIVKELDMLGRLVIPKEFRERFGLTEKVGLVATEEGVLLRSLEYRLVKIENDESK